MGSPYTPEVPHGERELFSEAGGAIPAMSDLSQLSTVQPIDLDELRQRLARMSDTELRRFGDAAQFMCSPDANLGTPPREVFVVQLHEARAEWKRRHCEK
jgi:hypothetical protein